MFPVKIANEQFFASYLFYKFKRSKNCDKNLSDTLHAISFNSSASNYSKTNFEREKYIIGLKEISTTLFFYKNNFITTKALILAKKIRTR